MKIVPRGKWLHIEYYRKDKKRSWTKPTGCPNTRAGKIAAKEELEKFRSKQRSLKSLSKEPLLFSRAYAKFIELQTYEPATISNRDLARDLIIKFLGDRPLDEYGIEDFLAFNKWLSKSKLSVNTQAIRTKDARTIFNFFKKLKWRDGDNPVIKIAEQKKSIQDVNTEDLITLFKHIKNRNQKLFNTVTFMLLTGWRAEETAQLAWDDLDLDPFPQIRSWNKVTGDETWTPLLDPAVKLIKSLPDPIHKKQKVFGYKNKGGLSSFYKYQDILWNERRIKLHKLRGTFITELLASGVNLDDAKDFTRHSNVKVIMEHYRALQLKRAKASADAHIKDNFLLSNLLTKLHTDSDQEGTKPKKQTKPKNKKPQKQ